MQSLRISSTIAGVSLLLIGACALVGCGSVRSPLGLMRAPAPPPSVRAAEYARAVNLKPADLPYFEAQDDDETDPHPARERRLERKVESCIGIDENDEAEPLASVSSPSFSATSPPAYLSIQSTVEVEPDLRGAARAVQLMRGDKVEGCLRRVYIPGLEGLEPSGVELRRVSISRLRPPLPGVSLSYGYRIDALATVSAPTAQLSAYRPVDEAPQSMTLPMHLDLLSFIVGPASVSLSATAMPTPASRILERNLLIRLHSRAVALAP
jgi:hypothetical protein